MRGALGSSPVYLGREMVLFFRVFWGGLIRFIFFFFIITAVVFRR